MTNNILKTGSYADAKRLNYGIKRLTGSICTVKMRFATDIANKLDRRLADTGFSGLYITNASNKNCRMIYGTIDESKVYALQYTINIAKAERLEHQAKLLREDLEQHIDCWS